MERQQELTKLINVLKQTARAASQPEWSEGNGSTSKVCVDRFNKIYARLCELEPTITTLFDPLPEDTTLHGAAMACRQLAAYFEDELDDMPNFRMFGSPGNSEAFRKFWKEGAADLQDLGDTIRDTIQNWSKHYCDQTNRRDEGCQKKDSNSDLEG